MAGTVEPTAGPWSVFEHRDSSGLCIGPKYEEPYFTGGEVNDVCTISGGRYNGVTNQQRADARLISASPEMLTALAAIVKTATVRWRALPADSHEKKLLRDARSAIAKATSP